MTDDLQPKRDGKRPRGRRGARPVWGMLVVAVVAGLWFVARVRDDHGGLMLPDKPLPPPAISASMPLAMQLVPSRAASTPPVTPADAKQATPAADRSASRPTQLALELCGIGRMSIALPDETEGERWELLPRPLGQYARAEAWDRITSTLDASPVDRERAAAMVLRASGLLDGEAAATQLARQSQTTAHVQQLAMLARQTRDVGVLQWALAICQREPALEACVALSPRDLVALAPQDGRNWLLLAAADAGRREEALRRAAQAPTIGSAPSLMVPIEAALPADLPPYLRHELQLQALGFEFALPDPSLSAAASHCRRAEQNRSSTCGLLAEALQQRGPDLLAMVIGRKIGEGQGWAPTRVAAAKAEEDRLQAQFPGLTTDQPYGCAEVGRMRNYLLDRAAVGERAALQRQVAAAASAPSAAGAR